MSKQDCGKKSVLGIGQIGVGRLGLYHAENIATRVRGARLMALCSRDQEKLAGVANRFDVPGRYARFEDMLADPEVDAVSIVSPSAMHCEQVALALAAGKHVFCEKPMGVSLSECAKVAEAVAAHPDLVFMLGFLRRYDDSYQYARRIVAAGEIGRIVLFRSYTQDHIRYIDGALAFAPHSGGHFLDMSVHDIDVARWFIGSEPERAWAVGGCFAYPQFGRYGDGDNVSVLMQCRDDTMIFIMNGRTAAFGYNVETEIVGTKGMLRIGSVPQLNLVEVAYDSGIKKVCSSNFRERFGHAFVKEMQEFVDCVLEDRKPEVTAEDGCRTTHIACRCRESFNTGQMVRIDE